MTLSDLKVVRVMCRSNFNYTGTKFHINIGIGNNRKLTVYNRKKKLLANEILITVIIRVYGNCGITQHGFRTCGCELDKLRCAYASIVLNQRILNVPEMACLLLILYLGIGNGGITYRTPVDNTAALVNPALFMHLAEHFGNGLVTALIHGETFSVPVTGRA